MHYKLSKYLVTANVDDRVLIYSTRSAEQISISTQHYSELTVGNFSKVSQKDIEIFKSLKIIVEKSCDEFIEVLNLSKVKSKDSAVLNFIIIPSASCPLGCNSLEYGGYCGQDHSSKKMTDEIMTKVISGIEDAILPSHKKLSISWFGAEPLTGLSIMENISLNLIDIARKRGLDYYSDLVTGGTLLTKDVARNCYLKYKINSFNVTIDGPKEQHDQRRCTKGGKPTFDTILKNINDIINDSDLCPVKLSIRCNVDSRNIEHVHELIDFIAEKNWQQRVDLYFVAVHSWGTHENQQIKLTAEDYAAHEIFLIKKMQRFGFQPYLLPNIKPVVCRVVASSRSVIGHDGNIHKCTETPLTKTFFSYDVKEMERIPNVSSKRHDHLGTVLERPMSSEKDIWNWHGALEQNKYPCTTCEFLPTCGGSCPLSWMNGVAQCPSYKFNMKDRMLLYDEKCSNKINNEIWPKQTIEDIQFTPLNLIKKHFEPNSFSSEFLIQFENLLKSSRIKSKFGNFLLAEYQIKQAHLIKLKIGIYLPLRYLLNASEELSLAYTLFKQGQHLTAKANLFDAIDDLFSAKRNMTELEIVPVLIQTAINLARIQIDEGDYSLITKLQQYLTNGTGLTIEGISFPNFDSTNIDWASTLNNFLNSLFLMKNKVESLAL